MNRARVATVLVFAVLASVGAAATASAVAPAADPTATTVTPASGAVRGVTDTQIKVGGLGHVARYPGADIGARARFERANRQGGVNGRTFVYIGMRDDGGSAAANVQAATRLVRDDQVFAIAPVVTPDLGAVSDLLAQRVPYFGWAVSSNFCGNQWGFSFTGCMFPPGGATTTDIWGVLVDSLFVDAPGRTAAVVSENTESGHYFVTTLTAGVEAAELDVVAGTTPLPIPAVADYGAIAQQILISNQGGPPDAVFVVASFPNVAQLRQALRSAGFLGVFTNTVEYEPDVVASATGSFVFAPTAAVESAPTNPAMAQLVGDVNAIAAGRPIDQAVIAGYWSADLFITTVERAGRNLTPDRLVKKANTRFTYKVKDTVGPVRFPDAHDEPAPCGTLVQSTGSAYTIAQPYRCGAVVDVAN